MSYSAFGISPFQREVGSSNDNCSHFGRFACWPRHKGAAATGQRLVGQIPEDGSAAGRLSHNEHCARLVSNAAYVTRAPMDTNWHQWTPIEIIRHHWTPRVDTSALQWWSGDRRDSVTRLLKPTKPCARGQDQLSWKFAPKMIYFERLWVAAFWKPGCVWAATKAPLFSHFG